MDALLELGALTGFVVAQPVFAAMSAAAELLLFRRAEAGEIVALTAMVVLVPPLALWGVGLGASVISVRAGWNVHIVSVAALATLLALQTLRPHTSGLALAALALVLTAALLAAYRAWRWTRTWLRAGAIAPFVFAGMFLFASPVAPLLRSGTGGLAGAAVGETAPVVMILLDELPLLSLLDRGEIDARLYPNLAFFAAEATFFRNATSVAARTVHSVPAILTGRLPTKSAAPVNAQFPGNLSALLSATHDIHAFESVTALCPSDVCMHNEWGRRSGGPLVTDAARIWARASGPHAREAARSGTGTARRRSERRRAPSPRARTRSFSTARASTNRCGSSASSPRSPEPVRRSTSSTSCCRTRRGASFPTDVSVRPRTWASSATTSERPQPGPRSSIGNATSFRRCTSTGCWARR